ncbi:hypothetical protein [Sphingomonas sp.]|uniref:hypothetical protein n=1 Tax=Sphingomonas sp. TaxID=28214 RepID=UPI001B1B33BC|nr:hypothetical protein [Sphingomonas sp.]MBO9714811.1 hypothetical protein [Sphingomonas sp.]
MTRIGNVDQVLLLLREQLHRTDKERSVARTRTVARARSERPIDRARALAALDSLGEDEVRRAVVRGLLTEELGEAIGNDAPLQAIVDDVVRIIAETPGGADLMERAIAQLKGDRA